jgi:predicted nucleic acid-binding protein
MTWFVDTSALVRLFVPDGPVPEKHGAKLITADTALQAAADRMGL